MQIRERDLDEIYRFWVWIGYGVGKENGIKGIFQVIR